MNQIFFKYWILGHNNNVSACFALNITTPKHKAHFNQFCMNVEFKEGDKQKILTVFSFLKKRLFHSRFLFFFHSNFPFPLYDSKLQKWFQSNFAQMWNLRTNTERMGFFSFKYYYFETQKLFQSIQHKRRI